MPLAVALFGGACKDAEPITGIQTSTTQPGTGRLTWTSIQSSRTLCPELNDQVGHSWSFRAVLTLVGPDVTLKLYEAGNSEAGVYRGTLMGGHIRASGETLGGMACPNDAAVTPQAASNLTATLDGGVLDGDIADVYVSASDRTVFYSHFHFQMTSPTAP